MLKCNRRSKMRHFCATIAVFLFIFEFGALALVTADARQTAKPLTPIPPAQTTVGQLDQLKQSVSTLSDTLKAVNDNLVITNRELQNQISQLKDKISNEEKTIANIKEISPDQATYLNKIDDRETKFDSVIKRIVDSQGDIAKNQLDMSRTLFGFVPVIIGVIGASVGLGSLILKWWADNRLKYANEKIDDSLKSEHEKISQELNKVIGEHDEKITRKAFVDHHALVGYACVQLAQSWWKVYDREYLEFVTRKFRGIREPGASETCQANIRAAKSLIDRGKEVLARLGPDQENDTASFAVYANLQNHWVYHAAAEAFCSNECSVEERNKIISVADQCLTLSTQPRVLQLWHELKQSAAFALIVVGDEEGKARGKSEMLSLLEGRTPGPGFPPPAAEWLNQIWKECFPAGADGLCTNLFDLERMPSPPSERVRF